MRRTNLLTELLAFLIYLFGASQFIFAPVASFSSIYLKSLSNQETPSRLGVRMSTLEKIDPHKTAVVLIEYQNEFTTEGGKLHDAVKTCMDKTQMLTNSQKLMNRARELGCQIIHVPISFEPGHSEISTDPYGILKGVKEGAAFTAGTWGAEICDAMKPAPNDLIAKGKSGLCGFQSTNLDFLLRQSGRGTIILGGFLTNCCVESTMRSAYERGYTVYTLKDCVAATSIEASESTIEYNFGMFSHPTSSEEVLKALSRN